MICLLAGNYFEAKRYAKANLLSEDEWFYPEDEKDLLGRINFHVLVVGTAGLNVPASYFERILRLAKERGRIK
jgi:hypothetical protein